MVLIAAWQASEKSKSSQCSIEKKYWALSFYFSGDSIQKLLIFLAAVLIKDAQNCLQTILIFFFPMGYVFLFSFVEEYKLNLVWAPKNKKTIAGLGIKAEDLLFHMSLLLKF